LKSPRDGSVFYHLNVLEEFLPQSKHIIYILTWGPNSSANWIRNRFDSKGGKWEVVKRRCEVLEKLSCAFPAKHVLEVLAELLP